MLPLTLLAAVPLLFLKYHKFAAPLQIFCIQPWRIILWQLFGHKTSHKQKNSSNLYDTRLFWLLGEIVKLKLAYFELVSHLQEAGNEMLKPAAILKQPSSSRESSSLEITERDPGNSYKNLLRIHLAMRPNKPCLVVHHSQPIPSLCTCCYWQCLYPAIIPLLVALFQEIYLMLGLWCSLIIAILLF